MVRLCELSLAVERRRNLKSKHRVSKSLYRRRGHQSCHPETNKRVGGRRRVVELFASFYHEIRIIGGYKHARPPDLSFSGAGHCVLGSALYLQAPLPEYFSLPLRLTY